MSDLMKVGPDWGGQGTFKPFTAGASGAQRVSDAHARYMQAVLEGRVFLMDSDSVTLAAANASKTAMGTAKFINGFWNPANSGKAAVIWRALIGTTSGTPAGPFFYNHFPNPGNVSSAATGTIRSALIGGGGASSMIPQTGVVLATLPANTAVLVQTGMMGGPAAVAAGAGLYTAQDELAGSIIVLPGTLFGLMALGAGTTHIVQSSLWWEEIPYPTALLVP